MSRPTARLRACASGDRWDVVADNDGDLIGWVERDALGSWVPFVGTTAAFMVLPPRTIRTAAGVAVAQTQGYRLVQDGAS